MRVLAAVVACAAPAYGDGLASSPTRPGYEHHEHMVEWQSREDTEKRGTVIDLIYMLDTFASHQLDREITAQGLLSLDIDLDLSALVGDGWGAVHINAVGIHGASPVEELEDVHGSTGNAAPDDVRVFEAWFEQPIADVIMLRVGLLSADQEFVIADEASTLLSATFGMTAQFSYSAGNPTYPIGTPGASARLELDDVVVRAALYDGSQPNTRGIPTGLGPESLLFGEAQLGHIKLGGWHHSSEGGGVYAIADAKFERYLGGFARAGYAPATGLPAYIDAGIRIGPGPFRPDDIITAGIAFAQTEMVGGEPAPGQQILIEAAYEAQLRWLTLQPDFQLIMLRDRNVAIAGLRATMVF